MTAASPDGRTLLRGAAWIGAFRWAAQLLSWAAMLVVLRLLTQADYGLASLALVIVGIAGVLSEFGMGTAIVALPELEDRIARQLHGAACLLAIGVGSAVAAAAPILAGFYDNPRLTAVVQVLSLVFLAEGLRLVPMAVLSRRLAYRSLAMLEFLRSVCTSGLVLGLAWAGWGYWALVLGNLGGVVAVSLVVTVLHGLRPARPHLADLRTPLTYSWHIFVGRGAWVLYRSSDTLVAGRLGDALLGIYAAASNLASLPGEKLGNVLTAATAPFFSAIQSDRAALRHYFLRVTEALALVLYPVLFGVLMVADLAVPLVLGEQWVPSVPVLRILILFAAVNAVTTPVSQVLNVTGNTRIGMLSGLIALCILPPAFVLGAMGWGIMGIAVAWVIGYPAALVISVRATLGSLGVPLGEYFGTTRRALEGVVIMAGAVAGTRWVMPPAWSAWLELGLAVLAGVVAYGLVLWFRHQSLLLALPGLLRGRRSEPAGPAPDAGP